MSEKRTLTIGVAINLGNYESLRLEVSDEVQSEEDAANLATYLNHVLDGYGQGDAQTRASIDKYRARVLEKNAVPNSPAPISDPLDELFGPAPAFDDMISKEEDIVLPTELPVVGGELFAEIQSEPLFVESAVAVSVVPDSVPFSPVLSASPKESPPVGRGAEEPVLYTCEKCGASVSKVQRDVSNLFMGKTLCKACMK